MIALGHLHFKPIIKVIIINPGRINGISRNSHLCAIGVALGRQWNIINRNIHIGFFIGQF